MKGIYIHILVFVIHSIHKLFHFIMNSPVFRVDLELFYTSYLKDLFVALAWFFKTSDSNGLYTFLFLPPR